MKGIILLINEQPPNNRTHVVFKHTPLDPKQSHRLLPHSKVALINNNSDPQQILRQIYMKLPQLNPDELQSLKRQEDQIEQQKQIKAIFGLEQTFFTELFIPKENNFQNSLFDLTVEANRFLSFPYFFSEDKIKKKGKYQNQDVDQISSANMISSSNNLSPTYQDEAGAIKIKAMNIIFVLDSYDTESISRIDYFSAVLQTFTEALAREQMRDHFISKQSYKILKLKQQAAEMKARHLTDKDTIKKQIIRESLLAEHLMDIFDSFYYRRTVTLKLNKWVQFSLNQMSSFYQVKGNLLRKSDGSPSFLRAEEINILPNQTLIIFDIKRTLEELPDDCTPLVSETIKLINPLKSLSELCVENGAAYSEVLKVARHLVYWKQASIIYPINLKQVYVISKNFKPSNLQKLSNIFEKNFLNLNLLTFEKILSIFSLPKKLEVHFSNLKMTLKDFVNMIIFLLQQTVIEEKSLYIVMKVPSIYEDLKQRQKAFFQTAYDQLTVTHQQKSQSVSRPLNASNDNQMLKKRSVSAGQQVPQSPEKVITIEDYLELIKNEDDQEYKLLSRMYPFFTGEFNHHDIMMISNCSRVRIDKMLEKHPCVLEKFWLTC